jgi:hypothetical protein
LWNLSANHQHLSFCAFCHFVIFVVNLLRESSVQKLNSA